MRLTAPTTGTVLTIGGRDYTVREARLSGRHDRNLYADVVGTRGATLKLTVRLRPHLGEVEVALDSYTHTGHRRGVHFARHAHIPAGLDAVVA